MALLPPFLGPGFRLGARWNRLGEPVKKTGIFGEKMARYLRSVNKEGTGGITWPVSVQLRSLSRMRGGGFRVKDALALDA